MELLLLSISIIIFNLFIFLKFENISKNFIFFDRPDGKLKKHKNPTSLIGGLIILLNLYLIIFFLKILAFDNIIFEDNFSYVILILGTIFFIIGFIDDLKNLSPNIKLISIITSVFLISIFFSRNKIGTYKDIFFKK